jgi:sulfur-oxidizing protein SoxY
VVPLGASTTLANVKRVLLLVEKNPSALIAMFNVSPEVEANFSTRAKMGQSSDVYAVAITNDGKAFFAKKEVKVTLGGCGG